MQTKRGGRPHGAAPFLWAAVLPLIAICLAVAVLRLSRRYLRFAVSGESMCPVFRDGDFLVVDRYAYRNTPPRVGDAVVAAGPRSPARELLKRVVRVDPGLGLWVEGDNPAASTDSRTFGWVAREATVGRVVLRYWPWPPTVYRPGRAASRASASSTDPSVGNASAGGSAGSK